MNLCMYKDILGKPNLGFHAARIGPFALWDIVGTLGIAFLLNWSIGANGIKQFIQIALALFILGEILHWLFCVNTAFMRIINSI